MCLWRDTQAELFQREAVLLMSVDSLYKVISLESESVKWFSIPADESLGFPLASQMRVYGVFVGSYVGVGDAVLVWEDLMFTFVVCGAI